MSRPALPLPLRNALAALALGALDDERDAAALVWLAAAEGVPPPAVRDRLAALQLVEPGEHTLLGIHAPHAAAVRAHAARAAAAASAYRGEPDRPPGALGRALARAAALWNAGLFFEVHEVLEAEWKTASGDVRQALQGLIQIAVAFHHLAHGNRRGARSLLRQGRARLAACGAALPGVDLERILAAAAVWESALAGRGAEPPGPPRLRLRTIPPTP